MPVFVVPEVEPLLKKRFPLVCSHWPLAFTLEEELVEAVSCAWLEVSVTVPLIVRELTTFPAASVFESEIEYVPLPCHASL